LLSANAKVGIRKATRARRMQSMLAAGKHVSRGEKRDGRGKAGKVDKVEEG